MKRVPEGERTGKRGRGGRNRLGPVDPERVPLDSGSRNESALSNPAALARDLEAWFAHAARDLPWRGRRTPYRVLVSETMLQQTQVARVAERFPRFIARFPSVRALAASSLDDVLQEWEGLGYYRRARLLHEAAKTIVQRFRGRVPPEASQLRSLPGVGAYTAGAVASIAHGRPEAIVDGNVARVLIRLAGRHVATDDPAAIRWCWERSRELVAEASEPGVLNEALMELGAVVCTPRSPVCAACPVTDGCIGRRDGDVDRIPLAKRRVRRTRIVHHVLIARPRREAGRLLVAVSKRPPEGLWASMWEFPTIEAPRRLQSRTLAKRLDLAPDDLRTVERFSHATTHRDVEFVVLELASPSRPRVVGEGELVDLDRLGELAMSVPQRRIADGFVARWTAAQPSSRRGGA